MSEGSGSYDRGGPAGARLWRDAAGIEWRKRGDDWTQMPARKAVRLVLDPSVQVLHDYLGELTYIPVGPVRQELAAKIEYYADPNAEPVTSGDRTIFECTEYRTKGRDSQVLVYIEKSC